MISQADLISNVITSITKKIDDKVPLSWSIFLICSYMKIAPVFFLCLQLPRVYVQIDLKF